LKKVKTFEQLKEDDRLKKAVDNLLGLNKPKYDIVKYLNNMDNVYKKDTTILEKYLAVFTVWQNYFGEQLVIADALRAVATSQVNYYYSVAVDNSIGSINQKKELARSNSEYISAMKVLDRTNILNKSLQMKFENCDRAYKLVSRILTKRLNIKEY